MPKFEHHFFICENERPSDDARGSCARRGAKALREHAKARCHALGLKGRVRVNMAGCLDACEHGPAMVVYPEGVWYTAKTTADVDAIIDEHLVKGQPVERLRMAQKPSKPEPSKA
jgi:(2Fe-2S) ferredoxin